jgi:hypothetical protein
VKFEVQTDVTYGGVSLIINKRKRASGDSLNECINTCASDSRCVATSFEDSRSLCEYFSKISGGAQSAPGVDFAQVTERAGQPIDASNPPTPNGPSNNGTSSTPVSSPSSGGSGSSGSSISRPTFSSSLNYNISSTASQSKTSSVQDSVSSATGSTTGSAAPSATPLITTVNGTTFSLEFDITYDGIKFSLDIALSKRAGQTLDDCLLGCSSTTECVGTAFDEDAGSCTYYSQIDKSTRKRADGVTFATVIPKQSSSSSSGISSTASSNSTATSSGSSASATPTGLEDLICPKLDGNVITNGLDAAFTIKCNTGVIGTPLTIDASRKRQVTSLPVSLSNCVDVCSTETACVATTFDDATNSCAYFSTFELIVAQGIDAALRLEPNGAPVLTVTVPVTVTETKTIQTEGGSVVQTGVVTRTIVQTISGNGGSYSTATVYATTVVTISSCAPTVVSLQSLTNIHIKLY